MAGRIRSIKPEILEDEKTAALSHLEWRLFVSLWLLADDYGNLRGDPTYVLGQALWAAGETREAVARALQELAGVALLIGYTVRGQTYYHIRGWDKHQKVTKPGKPRMPGPDQADDQESPQDESGTGDSPETPTESPGGPPETPRPDLRPPTSDLRPPIIDRESPPRAIPPDGAPATAYDPEEPRAIGRLAEATYTRVSEARVAVAAELSLPVQLPFPQITPSTRPRAFSDLLDRVREEGAGAPAACDLVVANLIAQARETRDVEWLSQKAFSAGAWANARERIAGAKRSGSLARASPPAPTPKRYQSTTDDEEPDYGAYPRTT